MGVNVKYKAKSALPFVSLTAGNTRGNAAQMGTPREGGEGGVLFLRMEFSSSAGADCRHVR